MPRITRKQKEAGHPGRKGGKPSAPSNRGFKVKPAHVAKDAYLGKARKLKTELIERAKIKKQFAKVLKEEGAESTRLRPLKRKADPFMVADDDEATHVGDKAGAKPAKGGKAAKPGKGVKAAKATADEEKEEDAAPADDSDYDSDDSFLGAEAAAFAKSMRQAAKARAAGGRVDADEVRVSNRAGPAPGEGSSSRGKKPFTPRDGGAKGGKVDMRAGAVARRQREGKANKPHKTRVLEREPLPIKEGSLRDLKKEAFGKKHFKGNVVAGTGTGTGRGRGQPNMAARMDVLLEKIRRTK